MVPNPQAKRVLCYGDSNTWGQSPVVKGGRFAANQRWTGVVQQHLGDCYNIIEEGLSSRTTDLDYARKPGRNGRTYFQPCLESQNPLDLALIMLGTNDYKVEFNRSAVDIAAALAGYAQDVAAYAKNPDGQPPQVAFVSPIYVDDTAPHFVEWYADRYYDARAVKLSHNFAAELQKTATAAGSFFLDAALIAKPGDDGIHMDADGHAALGEALAAKIKEWLQP